MAKKVSRRITSRPVPFKRFVLGGKIYKVLRWESADALLVERLITCAAIPWPGIEISSPFKMNYPIRHTFSYYKELE